VQFPDYHSHYMIGSVKDTLTYNAFLSGGLYILFLGVTFLATVRGEDIEPWIYVGIAVLGIVMTIPSIQLYFASNNRTHIDIGKEHLIYRVGEHKAVIPWDSIEGIIKRRRRRGRTEISLKLKHTINFEDGNILEYAGVLLTEGRGVKYISLENFIVAAKDYYEAFKLGETPVGKDMARYAPHLFAGRSLPQVSYTNYR